jgi:NADPH2:quinone reductase
MKAVVIAEPGGTEVLQIEERPAPAAQSGQVAVRVHAVGLNRADILQRKGFYPAPSGVVPDIPGLEFSGVVEKMGDGASRWKVGDRVMGIVPGGACAEVVTTSEKELISAPQSLSLLECAAIPEVFMTAYDALVLQAEMREGQHVLIHAVGSGVGTAAVQLVRVFGALSLGTSRSVEKREKCRQLGLDYALDGEGDWVAEVLASTEGKGAEIVLDLVGGSYLESNLNAVAERGQILVVGLVAGAKATLSLGRLLARRVTLRGTVLRSRGFAEKEELTGMFERVLVPLFDSGDLVPVLDRIMPMSAVGEAHRIMEENMTFGKVVLSWGNSSEDHR